VTLSRRGFVAACASAAVGAATAWAGASAQEQETRKTMSGPMDDARYLPVVLPARANASPALSAEQSDALEHRVHCQCGCTLDVYTCRTTDFTCPVSPKMHADIARLVAGGYTAEEILHAFVTAYGERVLMAPPPTGFNWAGYLVPSAAIGAGAVALAATLARWRHPARIALGGAAALPAPPPLGASPTDMARLDEALRRDDP
jgi:cytochrome c-type biogenesis protein CcmH